MQLSGQNQETLGTRYILIRVVQKAGSEMILTQVESVQKYATSPAQMVWS